MAELPKDRVQEAPPFSYVGVDTFGPWEATSRRTRDGVACSKRWAINFTCLSIRSIYIEVVDEMSSSGFITALRPFIALRGKVLEFRSERGTNFVGALEDLGVKAINVEDRSLHDFLTSNDIVWKFNPPHSSHMGGAWEIMIGIARRILESMLCDVKNLTHDILLTLFAEVCAIVNSRPLVPVSCDSDEPEILTPSTILTHKTDVDQQEFGHLDVKDMYRHQWRRVKADTFWLRRRKEYLYTLQKRSKWTSEHANLCVDDVVLLKDRDVARNHWPVARILEVFPSDDRKVRSVKLRIVRDGKLCDYVRAVVDLILLFKNNSESDQQ